MKYGVRRWGIAWLVVLSLAAAAAQAEPQPMADPTAAAALPLAKVVLYTSGVGFFQRDGYVDGQDQIALHFRVDDINDLLKSLVAQDFDGGQVTAVTYDAREPIARALKSFAIDLTADPGMGELLHQLRGQEIEVAAPNTVRGTILGVETKQERVGSDEVVAVTYVNILTAAGLHAIALDQLQAIRLTNPQLEAELQQALAILATGHDSQKKTVVLDFDGTGRRHVRVAYIMAAPVWKTSYRLVLSDTAAPFLQGWAIVENTTNQDWHNIELSLVSGRPISFVMDMYTPLFTERPVVVPELYASLRPQTYDQALDTAAEAGPERPSARPERRDERLQKDSDVERERRLGVAEGQEGTMSMLAPAAPPGEIALQQGVRAVATAGDLGALFEYHMTTPVSLARQKSAMLPIVNAAVDGAKVSIYNEQVHPKHPLHGFRLQNKTDLYLMQGPVSVFDAGQYAGDARLDELPPGQERLLSYAMDLRTEVAPETTAQEQELVTVHLRKGVLVATRRARTEKAYAIRNRDAQPKVVLIEHPRRPGWELITPAKAAEQTRQVYRFAVMVASDASTTLQVREEQPRQQTVQLTDVGVDAIIAYLQAPQVSEAVKSALQKVVALRRQLDETSTQLQRLEQYGAAISQEQERIRQNMERLDRNTELYARYVRKLDEQESDIEALQQEIKTLRETEDRQRQALQDFLMTLEME